MDVRCRVLNYLIVLIKIRSEVKDGDFIDNTLVFCFIYLFSVVGNIISQWKYLPK